MTFTSINPDRVDVGRDVNRVNYMTTMNGNEWQESGLALEPHAYTFSGAPILNPNSSQRIGNQLRGTLLLQDVNLIEMIQSLDRERIPER